METSIITAGFGGQGVLFAGQLLAYAAMECDYQVTWIPSYGPEMRGGTAHCTVIVGDQPIGAPIVSRPDIAIVLNQPSFDKYEPLVKPNGLLVVNSSLVPARTARDDVQTVYIPASDIAAELGNARMLNVVAIGSLLAAWPFLPLEAVKRALAEHLLVEKSHLVEDNCQALDRGFQLQQRV